MSTQSFVLVAIDRATAIERATRVAVRIAKKRGVGVHLLEVVPYDRPARNPEGWSVRPRLDRDIDEKFRSRIASAMQSAAHDGVHVRSVTIQGNPERAIPAYAQLNGAIMIVVEGHYGTSRLWRTTGVVRRISRWSPVPVLLLPSRGRGFARPVAETLRRIVAPVDFTVSSAVALRSAVDIARRHGARLTVLHSIRDVPGRMIFSGGEAWRVMQQLPGHAQVIADRLRRKAARFGSRNAEPKVVTSEPYRAIVDTASETEADLVVMGVAPRGAFDEVVWGSTLGAVLRRIRVPVLLLPVIAGAEPWSDEAGAGPQVPNVFVDESDAARIAA